MRTVALSVAFLLVAIPMLVIADEVEIIVDEAQAVEAVPAIQLKIFGRKDKAAETKPGEKEEKKKADEKEEEVPAPPPPPADPEIIRIFLMDGTTVMGKLSIKDLEVDTSFGKLTIPVTSILSVRPGLDSLPDLGKKINDLIEALGSAEFNEREAAQKELAKLGPPIRKMLDARSKGDDNAERVRRIKTLMESFEEAGGDDEEDAAANAEMIKLDTIVTTDFTVVGKVVQKQFAITSKFGQLTVALGDIKRADRTAQAKEELRRTIAVEGSNMAGRNWKNTKIRVEAGDRIKFSAEGQITMTPWGSGAMSGPDGSPNYGLYRGQDMPAGVLVGRIGDSGPEFKVGSRLTLTAKKAGTLYLAIGMNPSYANQSFPGKYDTKVQVTPK